LYYYTRTNEEEGVMFAIDPKDPTPLYAQLERAIRSAIGSGRLRAGDQLPTVRQMAVDLRVNANTVARVFGELERAGVVETRRGVGTFVKDRPVDVLSNGERERRLSSLLDRFLAEATELGVSVDEAIARLRERFVERDEGAHSDADQHSLEH
jgi:GntR family transcriptional regulator